MLWRNVTFFIWGCKCLALLDAIFKVLYIVRIFKNCTHLCPPIFIIISIILITTLIPVVQAGKDVSYFGIILIGFAITGKFSSYYYFLYRNFQCLVCKINQTSRTQLNQSYWLDLKLHSICISTGRILKFAVGY